MKNNISQKKLQKTWDKYPVNFWLKFYEKLFIIKKPGKKMTLFVLIMNIIWIISFILGFIFLQKIDDFNCLKIIIALGLSIPLFLMFIISFPAFIMKNIRLRKIAKDLNISLKELNLLFKVYKIKKW